MPPGLIRVTFEAYATNAAMLRKCNGMNRFWAKSRKTPQAEIDGNPFGIGQVS
jgi:hypothetical protein